MDGQLRRDLETVLYDEIDHYVPGHHDPKLHAQRAAQRVEELLNGAKTTQLKDGQAVPVIVKHDGVTTTHLTGTFRALKANAHVELAERDLEKLPASKPSSRESVEVLVQSPVPTASFPSRYVNAGVVEATRGYDGRLNLTVTVTEGQVRHLAGQAKLRPELVVGKDTTRRELVTFLESDEVLNEEVLSRLWVKVWRWAKKI